MSTCKVMICLCCVYSLFHCPQAAKDNYSNTALSHIMPKTALSIDTTWHKFNFKTISVDLSTCTIKWRIELLCDCLLSLESLCFETYASFCRHLVVWRWILCCCLHEIKEVGPDLQSLDIGDEHVQAEPLSWDEHYGMVLCFSRSIVVSVGWSIHNISFNWVWMSLFKWGWGHTIVIMALKLQTWPLLHVVYTWTLRENTIEFSAEVQIQRRQPNQHWKHPSESYIC